MEPVSLEPQSLAKQLHEALILGVLADGPRHGYQLALEIEARSEGFFRFNHGTLYPILHQLEKEGLLAGTWSEEGSRRRRKRYALTRHGRERAERQREAWREFARRLLGILDRPDSSPETLSTEAHSP